ncbi:hypothetical protein YC2023_096764 [Brassica napus]
MRRYREMGDAHEGVVPHLKGIDWPDPRDHVENETMIRKAKVELHAVLTHMNNCKAQK